jgi:hypothetical protein
MLYCWWRQRRLLRIRTITGTRTGRLAIRYVTITKTRMPAAARIVPDSIILTFFLRMD